MKGISLITALLVFGITVKSQTGEYVDRNRWETIHSWNTNKLKGSPKEVKQFNYRDLNDTSFSPRLRGKLEQCNLFKFNPEGNLILMRNGEDCNYDTELNFGYDQNGVQFELFSSRNGDTNRLVAESRRIAPGKYLVVQSLQGKIIQTNLLYILDGGRREVLETLKDDKLVKTTTKYFSETKLIREVESKGADTIERHYYYSTKGFPDSVINIHSTGDVARVLRINNEYGDPVLYYNDVRNIYMQVKYEYDSKGNWIRQILKDEDSYVDENGNSAMGGKQFQAYRLIAREIKY